MASPTFTDVFTRWTFNLPVTIVLSLLLAAYLLGVRAAAARGHPWPVWRTLAFVVLGLGSVVLCTMSMLAVYNRTVFWPVAVQVTLLISIVPLCLAVGDPLGLVRASLGERGLRRWDRIVASGPFRALTFPALTPVLAMATQLFFFDSGYLTDAIAHPLVMDLMYGHVLFTGCLVALPLLGVEVLPAWCTDAVRMLFAGLDGLLDAIPGIVLLTSGSLVAGGYFATVHRSWGPTPLFDQHTGGGLMLVVAEVVAIPLLCTLFFRWASNDLAGARADDAQHAVLPATGSGVPSQPVPRADQPVLERPWWETDPGFRDRTRPQREED